MTDLPEYTPEQRFINLRALLSGIDDPCTDVMARAAKFYDAKMKLKEVPLEENEKPGERAASIPTLGQIAACKVRGR